MHYAHYHSNTAKLNSRLLVRCDKPVTCPSVSLSPSANHTLRVPAPLPHHHDSLQHGNSHAFAGHVAARDACTTCRCSSQSFMRRTSLRAETFGVHLQHLRHHPQRGSTLDIDCVYNHFYTLETTQALCGCSIGACASGLHTTRAWTAPVPHHPHIQHASSHAGIAAVNKRSVALHNCISGEICFPTGCNAVKAIGPSVSKSRLLPAKFMARRQETVESLSSTSRVCTPSYVTQTKCNALSKPSYDLLLAYTNERVFWYSIDYPSSLT